MNNVKDFLEDKDIMESLNNLEYYKNAHWYPKWEFSKLSDEGKRKKEDEYHKMKYKALLDASGKRIRTQKSIKSKHICYFGKCAQINEDTNTTM